MCLCHHVSSMSYVMISTKCAEMLGNKLGQNITKCSNLKLSYCHTTETYTIQVLPQNWQLKAIFGQCDQKCVMSNQTSHPYWQNNFLSTFSLLVALSLAGHGGSVLLAEVIRKLMCT